MTKAAVKRLSDRPSPAQKKLEAAQATAPVKAPTEVEVGRLVRDAVQDIAAAAEKLKDVVPSPGPDEVALNIEKPHVKTGPTRKTVRVRMSTIRRNKDGEVIQNDPYREWITFEDCIDESDAIGKFCTHHNLVERMSRYSYQAERLSEKPRS